MFLNCKFIQAILLSKKSLEWNAKLHLINK